MYGTTLYARSGVNQKYILQTLKEFSTELVVFEIIKRFLKSATSKMTFQHFSTIYTVIPHRKLNIIPFAIVDK